jgi:hypothetical protein
MISKTIAAYCSILWAIKVEFAGIILAIRSLRVETEVRES